MNMKTLGMIIFACIIMGFVIFINLFALNDKRKMKKEKKEYAGFYNDWETYCERRDNAFTYRNTRIYPLREEIKILNEACLYVPKEQIKELEEKMEEKRQELFRREKLYIEMYGNLKNQYEELNNYIKEHNLKYYNY